MKCSFCHTENRPDAQFCEHCGASLLKVLYCRKCQTENRATARYCDWCGMSLVPSGSARTTDRFRGFNGRPVLYGVAALLLLWGAFNAYDFYESHGDGIQPASDSRPIETQDQPVTAAPTPSLPSPPPSISTIPAIPDEVPAPSKSDSEGHETAEQAAQAAAKAQAEAEAQALARAQVNAQQQVQITRAIQAIRLKIHRSWIRPVTSKKDLKCRVRVKVMPDGHVIDAEIIASSGDDSFDTSAQNAVIQASPLPVPADKVLFDRGFRSFTFTFDPSRGTQE
jgi:TonB family protein